MAKIINIGKKLKAINLTSAVCQYSRYGDKQWDTECGMGWDFVDHPHEYNFNFCQPTL